MKKNHRNGLHWKGRFLIPYNREATGHPSICKDQLNPLSVIVNIVQGSMAGDDCRRTKTLSTV